MIATTSTASESSTIVDATSFHTFSAFMPQPVRLAIRAFTAIAPNSLEPFDSQLFWERLDDFEKSLTAHDQTFKLTVGSVAIASLAGTAGYVFWTIKGGYLMASMLSQTPAWRFMDPLPIYDALAGGYWKDEEEAPLS